MSKKLLLPFLLLAFLCLPKAGEPGIVAHIYKHIAYVPCQSKAVRHSQLAGGQHAPSSTKLTIRTKALDDSHVLILKGGTDIIFTVPHRPAPAFLCYRPCRVTGIMVCSLLLRGPPATGII